MTQDSIEPGPLRQGPEQIEAPKHSLRQRVGAVLALASVTAALAGVCIHGIKGLGDESGPNYAPAALNDSSPNKEKAEDNMYRTYVSEGQATAIFSPTPKNRKTLNYYFMDNGSGRESDIPTLREVAYMQDEVLFRPEYTEDEDNLYVYPFSIYNTTAHPVDLPYINYAVRGIKEWLNQASLQENGFIIGGHTVAKVKPLAVPHSMVMTRAIPPDLKKELPWSKGVTQWNNERSISYVEVSGDVKNPFEPWIVGTEVCQSLIDIYGVETISGHEAEQKEMQEYVSEFNKTRSAENNLRLASKESVCNSLGRIVGASYIGGYEEVEELISTNEADAGPLLDYSPFKAQIPTIIRLGESIKEGNLKVISAQSENSPTIRYYRQSQAATTR